MHKVLVTGTGAICPLGTTCAASFAAALQGQSGIGPCPADIARWLPQVLVAQAGITSPVADSRRFGVFTGIGFGGAQTADSLYTRFFNTLNDSTQTHKNPTVMHPLSVPRMMANAAAAAISMRWGLQGQSNTYSVACASSAVALGENARAIRHGYLDAAIVVGTEAMLNTGALMAWNALRVMLIETMAQLAGAGLLAGDPHTKTLPEGLVGVLASVRRCVFTHPVRPEDEVEFAITCRPIGARAVQVTAQARIKQAEVAQLEIMLLYTERQTLGLA